jgi:PAS domain S-box-containing protein
MRSAARLWLIVVPAALAAVVGAIVLGARSEHEDQPGVLLVVGLLIGVAFIAAGLVARTRRPENRMGLLLMAVGFTWLLGAVAFSNNSLVFSLGTAVGSIWAAVFVHALLAYPSGRLAAAWERRVVIGGYVLAGLANVAIQLFDPDPAACSECPENAFMVQDNATAASVLSALVQVLAVAYLLSVAVVIALRWRGSSKVARRLLGPVLLAGGVSIALLAISIGVQPASQTAAEVISVVAAIVFLAVPFLFLSGVLRSRLARSAVSQLLVEMPEGVSPEEAQENLRHALHDPSLELAYWLPERGGYVDVYGRALTLPEESPERAVTPVEYEDRPVAALIHDPTLREESELVGAVVAAARVTIERDRLQAELRARLDELQRERDFIRDVVNAAPSYFAVLQPDGRIVRFNDTLAAASGLPDDESVRDRPFWDVFATSEDADALRTWFSAATAGSERGEHEARMKGVGHELITAWTITPVADERGERRYLLAGLDLTVRIQHQQALAASELRSRALLEAVPDNIYRVARAEGRFLDVKWSDPTRLPRPPEEFIGATIHDLGLPPEVVERFFVSAEQAFATGAVQEVDYQLEVEGELLHLEARIVPSGEEEYYVIVRDVSDRRRAEDAVQRQRDFLSAVADATPSFLAIVGPDGRMSNDPMNQPLRELTGLSTEDAAGQIFWELVSAPEDVDEVRRVVHEVTARGRPVSTETEWLARGGERRLVAWTCSPLPVLDPGLDFHLVSGVDVTERAAQAEELRRSRARLVQAGDDERRRLERNLHDGAQQRLVSLSLSLRLAQAKIGSDPDAADELLSGAGAELALALEELRELARGIHPAVLTERGLGPALESLTNRAPFPVDLDCMPDERLPGPVEAAAFYVVSEALANVAKYAEASSVRVTVERMNGRAIVEVADDGKGGADPTGGSGLRGLVDRVEALDGQLAVESPAGGGTRVRAEIPLPQ